VGGNTLLHSSTVIHACPTVPVKCSTDRVLSAICM